MSCRQKKRNTSQVINLRRARKQRSREARAQEAAERRAQFGLPKAEQTRQADDRAREGKHLEGHRLRSEPSEPIEDDG